jgi:hypothetical protein
MPRHRKTSLYPKKKIKKPVKIERPVYPEYIENFIKEVESKTSCIVKVDQYADKNTYHVGVLFKIGRTHRCIWMVSFATEPIHLAQFWTSEAFRSLQKA